jgi:DNA replication and repair protein RecF
MFLTNLSLQNFRNHKQGVFNFSQKNIFLGENGSGKSNILEAIYLLATGKSFKADTDGEMIRYGEQLAVVSCKLSVGSENTELKTIVTSGKKFEVNGVPRRMMDFTGNLTAVLFGPQDLELVTGSPGGRRRYLDFVISQKDREYRRDLVSYEKGLRQRNKLLEMIREGQAQRQQLFFWDKLLIKDGEYITQKREAYLEALNSKFEGLNNNQNSNQQFFKSYYDKSIISESRLKQYETAEVGAGTTLVGPHRDNFVVMQKYNSPLHPSLNLREGTEEGYIWNDVSKYGSRGEQRMAVLWLKEGEIRYLEPELPLLLLDDVFSELDHEHREQVEKLLETQINNGGQVIMTTADRHMLPETEGWNIIQL